MVDGRKVRNHSALWDLVLRVAGLGEKQERPPDRSEGPLRRNIGLKNWAKGKEKETVCV